MMPTISSTGGKAALKLPQIPATSLLLPLRQPCTSKDLLALRTFLLATVMLFCQAANPVSIQRSDAVVPKITAIHVPATFSMDISPSHSDGSLVSTDESMSTSDTVRTPEVEYIDDHELAAVDSIEKKACNTLYISEHVNAAAVICKRDLLVDLESGDKIVNFDRLCATMGLRGRRARAVSCLPWYKHEGNR